MTPPAPSTQIRAARWRQLPGRRLLAAEELRAGRRPRPGPGPLERDGGREQLRKQVRSLSERQVLEADLQTIVRFDQEPPAAVEAEGRVTAEAPRAAAEGDLVEPAIGPEPSQAVRKILALVRQEQRQPLGRQDRCARRVVGLRVDFGRGGSLIRRSSRWSSNSVAATCAGPRSRARAR